ncbi:MAG: fibronectin type III domain-containing protein [Candidatus Diapherotrites archaeon]|nr:fibronectin type III domain-containing protein [Candidatus Diapherotrites archaeon]
MKKLVLIAFVLFVLFTTSFAFADTPTLTIQLKTYGGTTSNYSNDANVTVAITTTSGDINAMQFSCDNSTWSTLTTYSASSHFDMNSGNNGCTAANGSRTLYAKIGDTDNNLSTAASDAIILDFAPPAVTSFSPGATVSSGNGANGQAISIPITDDFNLSTISISLDRASTDVYDNNSGACTITGTSATCAFTDFLVDRTGSYTYTSIITDMAGNILTDTNTFTFTDTGDPTAPGKPSGYDINTTVYLNWLGNTQNDFNSYGIYRSEFTGFDTNSQTFVAYSDTNSYTNSGLDENTTYYYKITAFDWSGRESTPSDQNAFVTDYNYGITPTITRTDASCDSNAWCWDDSPTFSITGISGAEYSWIITTSTSTLPATCTYGSDCNTDSTPEFSDIANGTKYFKVRACKPNGCGNTSSFTLKLDDTAPSAPGSFASALIGYDTKLTWTASTDTGGSSLYRYYIYRTESSTFNASSTNQIGYVASSALTYTDTTPSKGKTYYYKIQAKDVASNYSSSTSMTPVSIDIPSGGEETTVTIKAKNSSGEYVDYYSTAQDLTIELTFSNEIDDMNLYITKGDNNVELVENMKDDVTTYSTAIVTSASYNDINIYVLAFSTTGWITGNKILYFDTTNPTGRFSNITTNQKLSGTYKLQVTATDNQDVNDVKIYVDGNLIGLATNANDSNWVLDFNTFDYNNEVTIKATITDKAGNSISFEKNVIISNSITNEVVVEVLTLEVVVEIIQSGITKQNELEEKLVNCQNCLNEENLIKKEEADALLEEAEGLLETNLEQAKAKTEQALGIYASLLKEVDSKLEVAQLFNPFLIIVPIIIIIAALTIFFGLKVMKNKEKGGKKGSFGTTKTSTKKEKVSWDADTPL